METERLKKENIRAELDDRDEKLGYKMRESVIQKKNYAIIIGNKEVENNTISFRKCGSEETTTVNIEEFITMLKEEIKTRKY